MPSRDKCGCQAISSLRVTVDDLQKKYFLAIDAGKRHHQIGGDLSMIHSLYEGFKEYVEKIEEDHPDNRSAGKWFFSVADRLLDVYTASITNFEIQHTGMGLSPNYRTILLGLVHYAGKNKIPYTIKISITRDQALEFINSWEDLGIL
jgi:hypothetical protein